MHADRIRKGETPMKKRNLSARFIGRFSSIQSVIFSTVAILVLSAVVIVTGVSMRFTNTSIFENSSQYTQTIIQQMNQNIDSYIDYMENIAYLISSNEDVQDYLFSDEIDSEGRYRILKQFETILDSRSDIRNVGVIGKSGRMLINNGSKSVNQYTGMIYAGAEQSGRTDADLFSCAAYYQWGTSVGDHFKPWNP